MKKLMLAFAVAVMAIGAQAASVAWSTGVFDTPDGGSSKTGSKYSDVYRAVCSIYSDSAGNNLLGSSETTATKKSGVMTGTIDLDKPAAGTESTYYTKLVITEIATGKTLQSEMGSFTWNGDSLSDPSLEFYGATASGFAGTPPAPVGGGWSGVPEPTSGILMLVGLGVLALRRRRA